MNFLILIVDSLRRDYCYSDRTNTPSIDRLRNEGVTFDQAISGASMTPPSMGSIFSGIYPHKLDMYDWNTPYPENLNSLFTMLSADYAVGSFVFDEQYLFSGVDDANVQGNFRDYSRPRGWISDHSEEDFFLFVHHYWVHGPYEPQDSAKAWSNANKTILKELRQNHDAAVSKFSYKYAEAVERMSENWLDGFLKTLETEGILEKTLIVFTGDHGESWGERYDNKSIINSNYHLHGNLLYDELIRVPLVIRYPKEFPRGETVQDQVRHIDLYPTIAGLAERVSEDGWNRNGIDLIDSLVRTDDPVAALSSAPNEEMNKLDKISIRYPSEKLIWTVSENRVEYYNLDDDPGELNDISDEHPDRVQVLKSKLEEELQDGRTDLNIEGANNIRDQLEDLGYL